MQSNNFIALLIAALFTAACHAATFLDKPSVATYWGQNSRNGKGTQKPLSYYCDSNTDVILVSFTLGFSDGSLPILNLADACEGPTFPGTSLFECLGIGKDIKDCQSKGKTVLMSMGGATGGYGFANNKNAEAFADTLWNIYGGGSSSTRPFGDAVLDGFDLDIEGGTSTGYAAMVARLRSHFKKDSSKRYYITGAPQCPFPDAIMGTVIDSIGFDALFVQFYNNYCSAASSNYNFDSWDNWAKKTSPNQEVKVFLGLPGSKGAAGSGYVPFDKLKPIVKDTYKSYSSFGGVMIWDASMVYANTEVSPNYQVALAGLVHGLDGTPTMTTTTTPTKTSSHSTTTKRKTKTTATSTTKTKHTPAPKPTPTSAPPKKCVSDADSCSTHGQYTCSGARYAVCNFGKWAVRDCPNSLSCFSDASGGSIYCGLGTAGSTCSSAMGVLGLNRFDGQQSSSPPRLHSFNDGQISARVSVTESNSTHFKTLVNMRSVVSDPLSLAVSTISLVVSNNTKVTSVDHGTFEQMGNTVLLKPFNKTRTDDAMSLLITLDGTTKAGVFVAPYISNTT